jgi:hypothetical protein
LSPDLDLVEHLAHAAAEAVRARRGAIESGAGNLHGVMIEIEVSNAGATLDVQSHLSWKNVIREARRAG